MPRGVRPAPIVQHVPHCWPSLQTSHAMQWRLATLASFKKSGLLLRNFNYVTIIQTPYGLLCVHMMGNTGKFPWPCLLKDDHRSFSIMGTGKTRLKEDPKRRPLSSHLTLRGDILQ